MIQENTSGSTELTDVELEHFAARLERHENYRVLRRLDEASLIADLEDIGEDAAIGAVIDTETTGKTTDDEIIELGLVLFAYDRGTGRVYGVVDSYNGLEDPGMPIPEEASRVNNITDEMVRGKRLDDARIGEMLRSVELVIAHNAGFDRPLCERRIPALRDKAWACSYREVDWDAEGIASAKLDYIAYRLGFFYEGHRAEVDCMALLKALTCGASAGGTLFQQMLRRCEADTFRVWAVGAPFEAKSLLSGAGYRWSPGDQPGTEKAWFKDVADADYDAELAWVKSDVYGGRRCAVVVDRDDKFSRFSGRRPNTERVVL